MDSIRGGWWKGKICVQILRVDMQRSTAERRKATLRRQQLARNMGEGGRPAPPAAAPSSRVEAPRLGQLWMRSECNVDEGILEGLMGEEGTCWIGNVTGKALPGVAPSHLRTFALSHFPVASQTSAPSLEERGWQGYSCYYKTQSEATMYLMPEGLPFLAFFSIFLFFAFLSIASQSRPPVSILTEPTHPTYLLQLPEMQSPVLDDDIGVDESTHQPREPSTPTELRRRQHPPRKGVRRPGKNILTSGMAALVFLVGRIGALAWGAPNRTEPQNISLSRSRRYAPYPTAAVETPDTDTDDKTISRFTEESSDTAFLGGYDRHNLVPPVATVRGWRRFLERCFGEDTAAPITFAVDGPKPLECRVWHPDFDEKTPALGIPHRTRPTSNYETEWSNFGRTRDLYGHWQSSAEQDESVKTFDRKKPKEREYGCWRPHLQGLPPAQRPTSKTRKDASVSVQRGMPSIPCASWQRHRTPNNNPPNSRRYS
ncbi:hypothetical protein CMUS01_06441 [Colletotrichum musicola]|uniref:Uncharacterized protein n=1 Tax=Colletotrichum musicola TaxID=2175873 RepID=A0A8H6KLL3_9PEZI|nr:hypothetical protein CMUS01_06441 [Colletotrichum musicola]